MLKKSSNQKQPIESAAAPLSQDASVPAEQQNESGQDPKVYGIKGVVHREDYGQLLSAKQVAEFFGRTLSFGYTMIARLNKERAKAGKIVLSGYIPTDYFWSKFF